MGKRVIKFNVSQDKKHSNENFSHLGLHCIDTLMHEMIDYVDAC